MPLELDIPDQQTANNSQNAPPTTQTQQKQEAVVTLELHRYIQLHKYILLLASLVATVTYAAGFSPPGDVWQDTAAGHLAGDPIIRDTHHKRYVAFFYCNATAFAASLVVIVLILIFAYLDDKKQKPNSTGDEEEETNSNVACFGRWILPTLQLVMVVDLLSLMGAYAAGTCRDTFTTIYSSVLVGFVVLYLIFHKKVGSYFSDTCSGSGHETEVVEKEEQQKAKERFRRNVKVVVALKSVANKAEQDRPFRKVLMLLATFAVSITYVAGLSTPGGFWDSAGAGHRPGDAILKDRHNTRLAVFLGFNTLSFVASLLIIVVLLDRKPHHRLRRGFIVVALLSLIVAYNAGSCRKTDTTVYVASLIPAVLVYILFLLMVTCAIDAIWKPAEPVQKQAAAEEPKLTEKEEAAKKARSLVLLLATLAATITYQAGLDPPGGVWQENSGGHTAGDPILLTTNPRRYKAFFYCNSVSLVASLVAIVPVDSKLLLQHHVLEAVMILDLFGLIGAYAAGSSRDVNTSIHAMALAGAVLVYVVIHVIFITLDDDTRIRSESDEEKKKKEEEEKKLVEKTRKRLLLFAILVATITYQAGLTPPGGFLLQDNESTGHHAGDPVLLYNFPRRYKAFFYCNSVSFMLSIALIILLVNPKLYRPAIRTHALSVCTAAGLFGLMGAYAAGSTQHLKTSFYIFGLVAVVIFFIVILFLVFWFMGGSKTPQGATMEPNSTQGKKEDKEKNKSIHDKRKYLMLLGILVASVTYQAGLEPPGGAWQSSSGGYEAGNPVMHDNRRPRYLAFFYSNSTSFMASVVVILLLLVQPEKLIGTAGNDERRKKWLVMMMEKLIGTAGNDEQRKTKWLVVMNTTIVLDLLGLLGAYAAGSSRRWKTSVYVLSLIIAVLAYMAFHLVLSCIIEKRNRSTQQQVNSAAQC